MFRKVVATFLIVALGVLATAVVAFGGDSEYKQRSKIVTRVVELDTLISTGKDTIWVPLFESDVSGGGRDVGAAYATCSYIFNTTDINSGENVGLGIDFGPDETAANLVNADIDSITVGTDAHTTISLSPLAPYMALRIYQLGSPAATDSSSYKMWIYLKY